MVKKFLYLVFFLGLTVNSYASIDWKQYDFFNNSGGLNNTFSTIAIDDKESSDLQNVILTTYGSFKTREGYDNINTSTLGASVICTGLKYFSPTSGSKFLIGVFDDDKIYKMDYASGPDGTWDDITGALSFAVGQNNLANFTTGQDTLII